MIKPEVRTVPSWINQYYILYSEGFQNRYGWVNTDFCKLLLATSTNCCVNPQEIVFLETRHGEYIKINRDDSCRCIRVSEHGIKKFLHDNKRLDDFLKLFGDEENEF